MTYVRFALCFVIGLCLGICHGYALIHTFGWLGTSGLFIIGLMVWFVYPDRDRFEIAEKEPRDDATNSIR